jgi:ribosomal protein S18 acetylase RimI-like enzyme
MIIFVFRSLTKVLKKMVKIRLATEEDSKEIIEFQLKMALESEGVELNPDTLTNGVVSVFKDPQKGKYFVAEDDQKIIGSMLTTYEWSDWRNQWVFWLQSVYIIPAYRGKGVFRLMYQQIKNQVEREKEVAGIRLYVDVSNKNAIGVYNSVGMNGEHYKVFEWMNE